MYQPVFAKSSIGRAVLAAVSALTLLALLSMPLTAAAQEKRQKVIDFEDEVVEGLNKRPLDSLNEIADKDGKHKKSHLYFKRSSFKSENAETLHAARYTP